MKKQENYMTKSSYCMRGQIITESAGGCGKTYVPYGKILVFTKNNVTLFKDGQKYF